MSLSRRSIRGAIGKVALIALGTPLALLVTDGCTQQSVATSLRSLEHSGRISFVCLAAPGTIPSAGLPLERCNSVRFESPNDYGVFGGETTQPHLYALLTQTTRGEVAVIDMSTKANAVLDQNPRVPGANFLPIAAQPVDIVSTSDGDATFVGVAEIGRQGIFAIPSVDIRPCADCAPKTLSDWPACALPGAPGNMLIIEDPPEDGKLRASCDGSYESIREPEKDSKGKYFVDVTDKTLGRPKIVTTIPELGAIAVIDAQTLFDVERDANGKPLEDENGPVYKHPPGSWKACPIERWVPLAVDVPVTSPPPAGTGGPSCVDKSVPPPAPQVEFESRPAGMARTEDKLFVADLKAPVIHVLDMKTPCEPIEREPLLPSSVENPTRIVTTNALAVSGTLASTLERFVYAVDDYDGSLMVFDVGQASTSRRPISRPHTEWTPFQPPDRIDFGVPVQDLVLIERDNPQPIPATDIAAEGIRCDPDPDLTVCTAESISCDPETLYRTSANFDRGAGPTRMRGAFAYLVLSTGQIAMVDIDDYDAACRMPRVPSHLNGCPSSVIGVEEFWESSGEASCNVVTPHTPRSANYMRSAEKTGQNQPGVQNFPTLYTNQGAVQANFDPDGVVMRATLPKPEVKPEQFTLAAGTSVWAIDTKTGLVTTDDESEHTLAANLEDPRAHTRDQSFSVIYEGALPGFVGKAAKLDTMSMPAALTDASSRFCDQGVLGQKAFKEMLLAENPMLTEAEAEAQALELADYVQIASSTPAEDDAHWTTTAKGVCSFDQCKAAFGPIEIPKTSRDMKIIEAYQDHVELAMPEGFVADLSDPSTAIPVSDIVDCCFPTLVSFSVRVGHQWAVIGTSAGFMHHVVPTTMESSTNDRAVGACRNSCDPRDARKNGRVRSLPHGTIVTDDDPRAFTNTFFRFVINDPVDGNSFDSNPVLSTDYVRDAQGNIVIENGEKKLTPEGLIKLADNAPERGTFFQFNTQGQFRPLLVNLATATTEIQPQAIGFVPPTGEVVITDGSLEGIILLNAGRLDVTRRYF